MNDDKPYDWDALFDGQPHQLIDLDDFDRMSPATFRRCLKQEAAQRGIEVDVQNTEDGLLVQAKLKVSR